MPECPVCKHVVKFVPRGVVPHYEFLDYHESGRYDIDGLHEGAREYNCPHCGTPVTTNEKGAKRFLSRLLK